MRKHNRIAEATVVMLMMMLTIGLTSPAVLAEDGTNPDGTATGANVAPEVTSVTAPSSVDPVVEYDFPSTVQDNNTLADIDNVVLILYFTGAGVEVADSIENHYTFKYDGTTWSEIGPDPAGSHINIENCTKPGELAVQYDNYSFAIILSPAATEGGWTARWTATDDNNESDYKEDTFTVGGIIILEIDDTTLTFSGSPGDENIEPTEQPTVCTVNTNLTFKIGVSLSGNWTGATHGGVIAMDYTDAAKDNVKTDIVALTSGPQYIWTGVESGENVKKDIYWFLELPVPLRDDVYTTIFQVQAVA